MKYNLLIEKKFQHVETMYHGTSSTFLNSILKNGLLMNPPKRTFSRDTSLDQVGYDSYPGVYLTRDKDYAIDASDWSSRQHGGDAILITVNVVTKSAFVDEDDVTSLILNTLSTHFKKYSKLDAFIKKMNQLSVNGRNKLIATIATKIIKKYHESYTAYKTDIKNAVRFSPSSLEYFKIIINRCLEILFDFATRDGRTIQYPSVTFFIDHDLLNFLRYDDVYEQAMEKLLKGVRISNSKSVRILRDIKFSGKTKIIKIENLTTQKLIYPRQVIKSNYYFFGNPNENYAWGIGKSPSDAINDGKIAFNEYVKNNFGDEEPDTQWEDELRACDVYPTDQHTYNEINNDGYQYFTKLPNGLMVIDQTK